VTGAGLALIKAAGVAILVAHRLIFDDSSDRHLDWAQADV
jgi:hypothetical protein